MIVSPTPTQPQPEPEREVKPEEKKVKSTPIRRRTGETPVALFVKASLRPIFKSLYYLRSKSVQRAGFAGGVEADNTPELREIKVESTTDYDECLACQ